MSLMVKVMNRPHQLYWWQWCQILGLSLPILFFSFGVEHRLLWALAAHFLMDFTLQSNKTSVGKSRRDRRTLTYHAFISGGYAGFIVGGLPGLATSVLVHYLVDTTNKFGLKEPVGPIFDQVAHILTLVAIWWLM